MTKQQWLNKYEDSLMCDYQNTTSDEYKTEQDFIDAMWKEAQARAGEEMVTTHESRWWK